MLGHRTLVAAEPWPVLESDCWWRDTVTLRFQINGRRSARMSSRANCTIARLRLPFWRLMK